MRCSTCSETLPADARFCPSCGARAATCFSCRRPVRDSDRFCAHCGTTLQILDRPAPEQSLPPERKRITVLFADLVGSTALIDGQDPEQVYAIYNQSLRGMSEAVLRWGGTVGSLMGDGMMAFFGAPISREDDAERAALAALAIVESLGGQESPTGKDLHVRVGLHTGSVLLASLGIESQAIYTAVGETVTIAARLEGLAAPDTVVASDDTWRELAAHFEGESLGPMTVRGKREPISVWRLLRRRAVLGNSRGLAGMRAPLVGRDEEQRALQARLRALAAREAESGGFALVTGEAGIGKSRLLTEVMRPYAATSLLTLEGRSLSYTQAQPYGPWLNLLRGWFRGDGEGERDDLARLDAALEALLGPQEAARYGPLFASLLSLPLPSPERERIHQLDPEIWSYRVREALVAWSTALASRRSLVLYFEDLHWCDPSSLLAIGSLLNLTTRHPLLIIGASRNDMPPELLALLEQARLRLGAQMSTHELLPLDAEESGALIHFLLGGPLPEGLAELVGARADGNPFFVEEILRALMEAGALRQEERGWTLTARAEQIPSSLQAVLNARIDRLDLRQKGVLQRASVIGRVFSRALLERMGQETSTLDGDLYELRQQGLVRPHEWRDGGEPRFIFRHALTQEAAYASIPHRMRQRYHREVAEAIEPLLTPDATDSLVLLATHWERAGEAERASRYLVRAAAEAATRFAHGEAEALYSRALPLVCEPTERFALLEQRQLLYDRLGRRDAQQADIAAMRELAEQIGDGALQTRAAAYQYMDSIQRGEGKALAPEREEALIAALRAQGDGLLCLDLLELLVVRYWSGYSFPLDRARARELQREAVSGAAAAGSRERYLLNVALDAEQRDQPDAAVDALISALGIVEPLGDLRNEFLIHHRLGRVLGQRDGERSFEHHRRSAEIAQRMDDTRLELIGADNSAEAAARVGNYEEAARLWERCLVLQRQREQEGWERLWLRARYAVALFHGGHFGEAVAMIEQVVAEGGSSPTALELLLVRVEIAIEAGEWEAAERLLARVERALQSASAHAPTRCLWAIVSARHAIARGELPRAAALLAAAAPHCATLHQQPQSEGYSLPTMLVTEQIALALAMEDEGALRPLLARAAEPPAATPSTEWPLAALDLQRARGHARLGERATAEALLAEARARLARHADFFRTERARGCFMGAFATHRALTAGDLDGRR